MTSCMTFWTMYTSIMLTLMPSVLAASFAHHNKGDSPLSKPSTRNDEIIPMLVTSEGHVEVAPRVFWPRRAFRTERARNST